MIPKRGRYLLTVIVILLTLMFFLSGLDKLGNLNKVALGLQKRVSLSVPFVLFTLAIFLAAILEIVAPMIMVHSSFTGTQFKWASFSALALAVFTVLATYLYHFPPTGKTYYPFISNVTTVGGLLLASTLFGGLDWVANHQMLGFLQSFV